VVQPVLDPGALDNSEVAIGLEAALHFLDAYGAANKPAGFIYVQGAISDTAQDPLCLIVLAVVDAVARRCGIGGEENGHDGGTEGDEGFFHVIAPLGGRFDRTGGIRVLMGPAYQRCGNANLTSDVI